MNDLQAASWLARDLGLALGSGAAVPAALESVAAAAPPAWKPGLTRSVEAARRGEPLAGALRQAGCLPELLLLGLEASAEPAACGRLAELLSEQEVRLRDLRAALIYPALLAGVLALLFWLLLWLLGGSLAALTTGFVTQPPLLTRAVVQMHHLLLHPAALAAQIVVLGGLMGLLLGWWGTPWRLNLPLIGPWLRRSESIAWLSWTDYLLSCGRAATVPHAMCAAAATCLDSGFRRRVEEAASDCERGQTWHVALQRHGALPELAQWFMQRGAELEFPPGFLEGVARALRREQALESTGGLACLELLVVLAVAVALPLLAISFMLPLYQLAGNIG